MRRRPVKAIAALAMAGLAITTLLVPPVRAGTVVTAAGRPQGVIAFSPNALRAGDVSVNWSDVLLAFNDSPTGYVPVTNALLGRIVATNEALHFRNGEVWVGEIVSLLGDRFVMETTLLGQHTGQVDVIRAVDFKPGLPPVDDGADGVLYRAKGRPTPGALLWIDGDRAALDTPVGVAAVGRSMLNRYVFGQGPTPESIQGDEIALADGSILRGQIEPVNEGFRLMHPVMGEKLVGVGMWRWVRRHSASVTYLSDVTPESVETFPLIRQPAPPPRVAGPYRGAPFVRRMHISPKTVITYSVPGQAGRQVSFCALLSLEQGARGTAHVKVHAGGRLAFERTLDPTLPEPVRMSFDVEGGIPLELDVDFSDAVRLPCCITLDDAYVMTK